MNSKYLIATIIISLILGYGISKISVVLSPVSPNILDITQPVTTISGMVDKVEGNTVFLKYYTQQASSSFTIPPSSEPNQSQLKTLTYRITITKNTTITGPSNHIVYYFKKNSIPSQLQNFTVADLKKGRTISVTSKTDVRTLLQNQFDAVSIQFSILANSINGTIVKVGNNTIMVKAYPPGPAYHIPYQPNLTPIPPKEKTYTIAVTSETEISRMSAPSENQPSQPEKLAFSDLKKDMSVIVDTDQDVSETTNLIALRIEPVNTLTTAPSALPPGSTPPPASP